MIAAFKKLNDSEIEAMLRAPLLACALIAGADGNIDRKEIQEAIEVARKRASKSKASLMEYFRVMSEDFEDKLKIVIQSLPVDPAERNQLIISELSALNPVLSKLNKSFAQDFYKGLRDLTEKIASSSGGVLGIKSIGDEEAMYVNLPMIKDPST